MIKENIENIVKINNEVYMLGRLASGRNYYNGMLQRQDAVSRNINNDNMIYFFVEALSDETDYCKNILNKELSEEIRELYIGIDSQQLESIYPFGYTSSSQMKYKYLSALEKEEVIYNNLCDKLIIFKVYLNRITGENSGFKNLIIENILDINYDGESKYKTIPEVQHDIDIFETELLSGEIIKIKGYTHDLPLPEAIICGEYIYTDFMFSDWEKVEGTIDGWRFTNKSGNIRKLHLDISGNEYDTKVIRKLDSIVFIEGNYLNDKICNRNKESLPIKNNYKGNITKDEAEQIIMDTLYKNRTRVDNCIPEISFLNRLKNYTMSKNLYYDMKDIANLHVSIKTNYMTIVAGMSGTGKTQISLAYADVLGLSKDEGTLLFLPITPSYTEPEDLTGYLNTNTGLYVCSETGLIDLLIHAQQNPDKLHFIVFDEMNLSQVEHWFAPFISLLELDEKDRNLKLYSENLTCHNKYQYNHTIKIGDNIRFIGTVNLDETTKDFSDRLLDRANLVSLKKGSLKDFKRDKQQFSKTILEDSQFTFSDYSSWINNDVTIDELLDSEIELLDELHLLISSNDSQKGVSFRIAEKIASYLSNLPVDENGDYLLDRGEAFDLEIKQRILTKIKGTERQIGKLIGRIDPESNEVVDSELSKIFNNEDIEIRWAFKLTKNEIRRKARELSLYGYAN